MSDTPRTDAFEKTLKSWCGDEKECLAFARQLEREVSAVEQYEVTPLFCRRPDTPRTDAASYEYDGTQGARHVSVEFAGQLERELQIALDRLSQYGDPLARRYDNAVTHTLQPSRHEETNTPVINCARHGKLPSNNGACIVCDERERIISWLQTGGGYCKDIADKLARREDICE